MKAIRIIMIMLGLLLFILSNLQAEDTYRVCYGEKSKHYDKCIPVGTLHNYSLTNLESGKTYYIAIETTGDDGSMAISNEISVETTAAGIIDSDSDGIPDEADNCVMTCNPLQLNADNDCVGDLCDPSPGCGGCNQPACEQPCGIST